MLSITDDDIRLVGFSYATAAPIITDSMVILSWRWQKLQNLV